MALTATAVLEERSRCELPLPDVRRLQVRLDRVDPAQRMFLKRMVRDTILEDDEAEVDDAMVADAASRIGCSAAAAKEYLAEELAIMHHGCR